MRKSSKTKRHDSGLDIAFIIAAGVIMLFLLAYLLIRPPTTPTEGIMPKAEIIIIMTWPDELDDDIDMYVKPPTGSITWYVNLAPKDSFAHLDRDDLGGTLDTIIVNGESIKVLSNIEEVSIRKLLPGEYIVNIHLYKRHSEIAAGPIPVTVEVKKLNPKIYTIFKTPTPVELFREKDQKTVVRFKVTEQGSVTDIFTYPEEDLEGMARQGRSIVVPRTHE